MKKETKVVMYDTPGLIEQKSVILWVGPDKKGYQDEHMSRYANCTHKTCECGEIMPKHYTKCSDCRRVIYDKKYAELKHKDWDGKELVKIPEYVKVIDTFRSKNKWYDNNIGEIFPIKGISSHYAGDDWHYCVSSRSGGISTKCCIEASREAFEAQEAKKKKPECIERILYKTPSNAYQAMNEKKLKDRIKELEQENEKLNNGIETLTNGFKIETSKLRGRLLHKSGIIQDLHEENESLKELSSKSQQEALRWRSLHETQLDLNTAKDATINELTAVITSTGL